MKYFKTVVSIALLSLFALTGLTAQEAMPAAGSDAFGNGGTASYTVGQVAFSNLSEMEGSLNEGVQHPFEIYLIIGTEDPLDAAFECSIFPNPATDQLHLQIGGQGPGHISFRLYNAEGKLLESGKIETGETTIPVDHLSPSTYFLKLSARERVFRTFKIIKN